MDDYVLSGLHSIMLRVLAESLPSSEMILRFLTSNARSHTCRVFPQPLLHFCCTYFSTGRRPSCPCYSLTWHHFLFALDLLKERAVQKNLQARSAMQQLQSVPSNSVQRGASDLDSNLDRDQPARQRHEKTLGVTGGRISTYSGRLGKAEGPSLIGGY